MNVNYRRCDTQLKNLVAESGDIERFRKYGIPDSSLRQWLKDGPREFFTLPELEMDTAALVQENMSLKSQLDATHAKHDLVSRTIKIFGFQIQYKRLPSPESKSDILAAIKSAAQAMSLETCLEAIWPGIVRDYAERDVRIAPHVVSEFDRYLQCGILQHGFLLLTCPFCDEERTVAWSCKCRGFCSPCGSRRMAQKALRLEKEVWPEADARKAHHPLPNQTNPGQERCYWSSRF